MTKIRISTKHNAFTFSISPENRVKNNNINLTQTDIINTSSMIFTLNYIYKNIDIVSSFVTGLAIQRKISKVIIKDYELSDIVLLLIQNIKELNSLEIIPNKELSYEIYERLLYCPYIKELNCYTIKSFMLEKLDKNGIGVTLRNEIFFMSDFMKDNSLNSYSNIFYKRTINIKSNLDEKDIEDLQTFCKINKYLKEINIYYYQKEIIRKIINIITKEKKKNIKINIIQSNENINDIFDSIEYLRFIQNKVKKDYNFKLVIVYSDQYKKDNILNQINLTNIKVCCFLVIVVVGIGLLVIEQNKIVSVNTINDIQSQITKTIDTISNQYDNVTQDSLSSDNESNILIDQYTLTF